jgi:muconolactone delta-isomerase
MKYLVTMELAQPLDENPDALLRHLDKVVIPSHETLIKLEKEGKILAGGDMSGRRGSVMILEAASNAEVSQILATMPLWATQKTEVIPLESFQERQAMHRQLAERLKVSSR